MPDKTERLHIFATIKPKSEFFSDAKGALEKLVPLTLEEPGCHLFTVLENRDEQGVLHLFEIFEDEDAVQAHYDKDYTKQVFARYQSWLAEPVVAKRLSVTSPLSSDQFYDN
ncbi:MAG: antibiotic biosynthesis monooxygenase [Sneathiellales bacterium]|nr:antibiotic biosynthesis monooxygenase [Sneathiellales bacterium]